MAENQGAMPGQKNGGAPWLKLIILFVLLAGLSFVLVHFNIVSCGFYSSAGCEVYYSIVAGGKPKVLVVHGTEGIGDPGLLYDVLKSNRIGATVNRRELALVTLPLLSEYQMVIVERAKKMGINHIKMFQEYVAKGGRLVWVGDAGTIAPENESDLNYFLLRGQRKSGQSKTEYIGPWARRQGDKQVSLDYLLGVDYKANYCDLATCSDGLLVGFFEFPEQKHRLANGLSQQLPFYGNFSIVEPNENAYQRNVAFMNYGTNLIATPTQENFWLKKERQDFGKEFPVIVESGFGGRVAYYAFPPEYFVSDKMPLDPKTGGRVAYWGLIENLYYGMLYK